MDGGDAIGGTGGGTGVDGAVGVGPEGGGEGDSFLGVGLGDGVGAEKVGRAKREARMMMYIMVIATLN